MGMATGDVSLNTQAIGPTGLAKWGGLGLGWVGILQVWGECDLCAIHIYIQLYVNIRNIYIYIWFLGVGGSLNMEQNQTCEF